MKNKKENRFESQKNALIIIYPRPAERRSFKREFLPAPPPGTCEQKKFTNCNMPTCMMEFVFVIVV